MTAAERTTTVRRAGPTSSGRRRRNRRTTGPSRTLVLTALGWKTARPVSYGVASVGHKYRARTYALTEAGWRAAGYVWTDARGWRRL